MHACIPYLATVLFLYQGWYNLPIEKDLEKIKFSRSTYLTFRTMCFVMYEEEQEENVGNISWYILKMLPPEKHIQEMNNGTNK